MENGSDKKARVLKLSEVKQGWSIAIGSILVVAAFIIYYWAPVRHSEKDREKWDTSTQLTEADSTTIAATTFLTGAAVLLYGLNGVVVTRFAAGKLDLSGGGEPDDTEASRQPPPDGGVPLNPPPVGIAALPADQVEAIRNQTFEELAEQFFRLSSWNGKKVLFACLLASKSRTLLDLRALAEQDKRMSYDYAAGYLIAASSGGVFDHRTEPSMRTFEITNFKHEARLLRHIQGHLPIPEADRINKLSEIRLICAYFRQPVPAFAQ